MTTACSADVDPKPPDAYFTSRAWQASRDSSRRDSARAAAGDSAAGPRSGNIAVQPARPAAAKPVIEIVAVSGVLRKIDGLYRFRPCRMREELLVRADPGAGVRLQDRFLWNYSVSPEHPMYVVFNGAVLYDSVEVPGRGRVLATDSAGRPLKFFFLADFDTLRVWHDTDCGGERPVPR